MSEPIDPKEYVGYDKGYAKGYRDGQNEEREGYNGARERDRKRLMGGVYVVAAIVGALLMDCCIEWASWHERVACTAKQETPERRAFTTTVVCVPKERKPASSDTLNVRLKQEPNR